MELDEIASAMGKGKEGKEGSPKKGAGKKQRAIDQGKYKTGLCKFFEEGKCLRGEDCTFAHSSDELKLPKLPLQGASKGKGKGKGKAKGMKGKEVLPPRFQAFGGPSHKRGHSPEVSSRGRSRSRSVSRPRQWLLTEHKKDIVVRPLSSPTRHCKRPRSWPRQRSPSPEDS
ncbi:MAG: hypothetical protein GY772_17775, partial [bacterium]|nr:hypothetical protein [bacterium]